jgi:hypothetical protein
MRLIPLVYPAAALLFGFISPWRSWLQRLLVVLLAYDARVVPQ